MSEEKQYTDPQKKYPEPEVPVEHAWQGMKELLDAQLPLQKRSACPINKIWLSLLLVAMGSFVWWLCAEQSKPEAGSHAQKAIQQHDSRPETGAGKKTPTTAPTGAQKPNDHEQADIRDTLSKEIIAGAETFKEASTTNTKLETAPSTATENEPAQEGNTGDKNINTTPRGESENKNVNAGTIANKKNKRAKNHRTVTEDTVAEHTVSRRQPVEMIIDNKHTSGKEQIAKNNTTPYDVQSAARKPVYGVLKKLSETGMATGSLNKKNNQAATKNHNDIIHSTQPKRYTQVEGLVQKSDSVFQTFRQNRFSMPRSILKNSGTVPTVKKRNGFNRDNKFSWGLQWNINLPVPDSSYYFTSTSGKTQPYSILFPGIWTSMAFGKKHALLLHFKPHQTYFTGAQVMATHMDQVSGSDTIFRWVTNTTYLHKTTSISGSLQYNYQFTGNWYAGVGWQYNRQRRALMHQQLVDIANGTVLQDSLIGAKPSADSASFFKPSYSTAYGELGYRFKQLDLGGTIYMPLSSLSPMRSVRPLNAAVFLRWRLR